MGTKTKRAATTKSLTAGVLNRLLTRLDKLHSRLLELQTDAHAAPNVHRTQALALLVREDYGRLKEAIEDAMRYRLYQRIVYEDRDDSFDAYDPEGMDAELTSRLVEEARARA